MDSLENQLAEKITAKQELERDIKDANFRLDHVIYDIAELKDKIISELEEQLECTRQYREDHEEDLRAEFAEKLEEKDQRIQELLESKN